MMQLAQNIIDVIKEEMNEEHGGPKLIMGDVNAVPESLRFFELAHERAIALMRKLEYLRIHPEHVPPGFLWGLPVLIKDLAVVKGLILISSFRRPVP